jgi:hypothetical protein
MKRLIALFMCTAGCATATPVVRLRPTDPDVVWRSGRAVVTRESPSLRVAAAFDRQRGDRLAIRLEIQNLTLPRLELDPQQVTYQRCAPGDQCGPFWAVANPEAALFALDARRGQEQAAAENSRSWGTALLLLNAVGGVAAAASGHGRLAGHFANSAVVDVSVAAADADRHDGQVASIDWEREQWETEALRRTTLFPSQGLAGMVYLPVVDDNSVVIKLRVELGDQTFVFPFSELTVHPRY